MLSVLVRGGASRSRQMRLDRQTNRPEHGEAGAHRQGEGGRERPGMDERRSQCECLGEGATSCSLSGYWEDEVQKEGGMTLHRGVVSQSDVASRPTQFTAHR